jgi:hypothetical protein
MSADMTAVASRRRTRWPFVAMAVSIVCAAVLGVIVARRSRREPMAFRKHGPSVLPPAATRMARPRFRPHLADRLAIPLLAEPRIEGAPPGEPTIGSPGVSWTQRAADALAREDYASARYAAQQCLRLDPADRECFRDELYSYTRDGDFANAKILLEECLYDDPNDLDCLQGMVTQHVRDKDFAAARELAERIRVRAPGSMFSLLSDAQIAERTGQLAEAIRLYEGACSQAQEYACVRAEALRNKRDGK